MNESPCTTLFQPFVNGTYVKVAILNYIERLLIRNRTLCLMLPFGAQISVVLAKTGRYYGLKGVVFSPKDLKGVVKVVTDLLINSYDLCQLGGVTV